MSNIRTIAETATSEPSKLSEIEIVRLGAWIIDHEEHLASHQRLVAGATGKWPAPGGASLVDRLAGPGRIEPGLIEDAGVLAADDAHA